MTLTTFQSQTRSCTWMACRCPTLASSNFFCCCHIPETAAGKRNIVPLALNRINLTMLEKQFNAVELGAILIIDGARSHYSLSVEAVGFVPVAGCCGESGGISARPSSNWQLLGDVVVAVSSFSTYRFLCQWWEGWLFVYICFYILKKIFYCWQKYFTILFQSLL